MTALVGILNVTPDSFSDGGRYLDPARAVEHGLALAADGADWIDVGAESTHPDARPPTEEEELARLEPVVSRLVDAGLRVSVDTWRPGVMGRMLELGVGMINDVRGFGAPGAIEAVRASDARLVVMHSAADTAQASRAPRDLGADPVATIRAFFEERLDALGRAGVARERVLLDPGMGFFLSPDAEVSFRVLRELPRLAELGRPLYVCTSRKSFLGAATGRDAGERGAATLASELHARRAGAAYLRTHDVRALADAIRIEERLSET